VRGAALRADLTVTFGTHKPGLLIDPAREYAGTVRLVDIGLRAELPAEPELEALQHAEVAALLPVPAAESDKYRRGVVGVAAGSARYPGAAVLAVGGALRGGAGAVRYVGPAGDAVIARFPETLVSDRGPERAGRVQAWVVGPGAGDDAGTVAEVLAAEVPVLVDADGLRLADAEAVRARTAPTLMTPHAGEAAALLGTAREEVEAARLASVRALAERKVPGLRVVALLGMVRNSIGEESFVSDEIITGRSGVRVRIGNTDAEGRLVLADLLAALKEGADPGTSVLVSVATLTGHVYRAFGPYVGAIENGPARARGFIRTLDEVGELLGEPLETTRPRREDYVFVAPKAPTEDVLSSNRLASVDTARGHQGPFAFIDVAAGLRGSQLPFVHLDIAGVVVNPPDWQAGKPTGSPIAALVAALEAPQRG